MSLLTVLLSLFFVSGFATAGIYAPNCSLSTWQWVCVLSFPVCIPCPYSCLIRLALCSDIQQSRPKCLHGRSVHVVHLQRWL